MTSSARRLSVAWKVVLVADLGILLYGLMAFVAPKVLHSGFEAYTGETWTQLAAREETIAGFVTVGFRLIGALNLVVGLLLIAIAFGALRHGERWAWWALLVGNLLAYGAPMVYDRVVGAIGVFEVLEYAGLLAVLVALGATWTATRRAPG